MLIRKKNAPTHFDRDADIALGPIFFVMAILGILASAIAVGSGALSADQSNPANITVKMTLDRER